MLLAWALGLAEIGFVIGFSSQIVTLVSELFS